MSSTKSSSPSAPYKNQSARDILMVRPAHFGFNPETYDSNPFQSKVDEPRSVIEEQAIKEFDHMVDLLESKGVDLTVIQDTDEPRKIDAVFPNNWISFHPNGKVYLYPMFSELRRLERGLTVIDRLKDRFEINEIIDLSKAEDNGQFLEGTGSIVFDHINKMAYACASVRTDRDLFFQHCANLGYRPIFFHAYDPDGIPIYHTNVMMFVGQKAAAICLECIMGEEEQQNVLSRLQETGHTIIDLSFEQIANFAGNMLEIRTNSPKNLLVLSASGMKALTSKQLETLGNLYELLPIDVNIIETAGGGSVRCMMAEIFLPLKKTHTE